MQFGKHLFGNILFIIAFAAVAINASGQSADQNLPTPIVSKEISGRIDPLDIGDARLTRHYYAFEATPGDLLIALTSHNLNGDLDVFTAVTFRPLMKATMYAGVDSGELTKGIYLRTNQILILRVEARTPNDDPGSYHIRFGGTFAPFSGGIPVAENSAPSEAPTEKNNPNRLSSVGATISKPPPEKVEVAREQPASEEKPEKSEDVKPSTAEKRSSTRRTTSRTPRRNSRSNRAKPPSAETKTEPSVKSETSAPQTEAKQPVEVTTPVEKPSESKTSVEQSTRAQGTQVPAGPRLVIEKKDGTKIDRPMSTVRRLTIEGATIFIVLKTGRIERVSMSDVVRVAIEPQ